jgi:ferrous iron transport protein A
MCMRNSLLHLAEGRSGTIVMLHGGRHFQRKLRNMGIREGKVITLLARQPLGGPVVVEVDGRETTLGRGMARRIIVGP